MELKDNVSTVPPGVKKSGSPLIPKPTDRCRKSENTAILIGSCDDISYCLFRMSASCDHISFHFPALGLISLWDQPTTSALLTVNLLWMLQA